MRRYLLLAQGLVVSAPEHYTDNRGWNEAGIGPSYQAIIAVTVAPSDFPTLVFAEHAGVRNPLAHFAQTSTPNLYVLWRRLEDLEDGRLENRSMTFSEPYVAPPRRGANK